MEWKWSKANEKSLAHFVTDRTVELLKLPESRFDLVHSRENRRRLVEVIYNALVDKKINYAWEKYRPDDAEQRIRQPQEILWCPGEGTCLDLALLFCGICLGYDLLPMLIIIEGHALAAISLKHKRDEWNSYDCERNLFCTQELFTGEEKLKELQNLIDEGVYIAIECTGFAYTQSFSTSEPKAVKSSSAPKPVESSPPPEAVERTAGLLTFERAVKAGREQLNNQGRSFKFAIDIAVAHYFWKIEPLPISLPYKSSQPLTKKEYHERKVLVNKVQKNWIEGVLKNSLHLQSLITLNLKEHRSAVANPASAVQEFPEDSEKILPCGTNVIDFFYEIGDGRTLLILGEGGVGKTIALLKIAEKFLLRSEKDLSQSIPIVLNLSSWTIEKLSIEEWLVKELKVQYKVHESFGKKWIDNQELILLLDGLDEVKEEYQRNCVLALNEFIQNHGLTEIVICSRLTEYQKLSERLQLQKAICIQLLTPEQITQYLEKADRQLEALQTLLQQDKKLLELARSPLILSIMSRAYEGVSIAGLPRTGSEEERRQHIFNNYIKRMFERQRNEYQTLNHKYKEADARRWLIWLAKRMTETSQTIFLIERMQPSWLQHPLKKFIYSIGVGLSYGLAFGFCFGLTAAWSYGIITGLLIAIIFGLAFGISAWLTVVVSLDRIIKPIVDLIATVIDKLLGRESINQNDTETITTKIPNQEIKETIRTALIWGVMGALLGGVMSLIFQPQFFLISILFGLTYGATTQGRVAILHFNLRLILFLSHKMPWKYASFLDYASTQLFLQKVGGGYIFYHRLLQEHFARMK